MNIAKDDSSLMVNKSYIISIVYMHAQNYHSVTQLYVLQACHMIVYLYQLPNIVLCVGGSKGQSVLYFPYSSKGACCMENKVQSVLGVT